MKTRQNKREELHDLASSGRYLEVQSLVNEGVDVDRKNFRGQTPLMLAVRGSHIEVFELLVNSGADINCCDSSGFTVLHYASAVGSVEIVQSLVNKRVDLNARQFLGKTPLIVAVVSKHSSPRQVRQIVEVLVNSGADVNCCDDDSLTLMHRASCEGLVDVVQYLVMKGVPVDVKDNEGLTPLMWGAALSRRQVVELLINSGADIHCSSDRGGWTVLHFVSCKGWVGIIECLVNKGVAFDARNFNGHTPLHLAVQRGKIETADYLLKAGADCNLEDNIGETPFSILIGKYSNYVETIKLCIEKGAYVKSIDYIKLLEKPLFKAILQDVRLCSRALINKFNNKDLPLLYEKLASAQALPHIENMKIGNRSGIARNVEQVVAHEIRVKGFCNLIEMVPSVLSILSVKSFIEKI